MKITLKKTQQILKAELEDSKTLFAIHLGTAAYAGSPHWQQKSILRQAKDRQTALRNMSAEISQSLSGNPRISEDGRTFDFGREGVIKIVVILKITADDFYAGNAACINDIPDAEPEPEPKQ